MELLSIMSVGTFVGVIYLIYSKPKSDRDYLEIQAEITKIHAETEKIRAEVERIRAETRSIHTDITIKQKKANLPSSSMR